MNLFLAGSSNSLEVKFPKDLLFEGDKTSLLGRDVLGSYTSMVWEGWKGSRFCGNWLSLCNYFMVLFLGIDQGE